MSKPAKERFIEHIHETINALEFNCLQLSQDMPKFNSVYLTHAMKIMTGIVQRIRTHLIVNQIELMKLLPKGVKQHGNQKLTERQRCKAARR